MKRLLIVLVVLGALAVPAGAFASTGIVLKVQHGAHLIALAGKSRVQLIHTSRTGLAVGQKVSLQSKRLRNGTFAGSKLHVLGHVRHVSFRGFVVAHGAHRITLSAGGAIVTVKSNDQPKPGSEVQVGADVGNDGELEDGQTTTVQQTAPGGSIEGHVVAVALGTITIASDEQLLVLSVPSTIDVSKLAVGDEVLANFTQLSDGSLVLTSISSDQSAQAANEGDQGDNNNSQGDDGNSSGSDTTTTTTTTTTSSGDSSGGDQSGDNGGDQSGGDQNGGSDDGGNG